MKIKRKLFNAIAQQVHQRRPNNARVTKSQPQKTVVPQVQKPNVGMVTEQGRMQRQMMANVRQRWAIKSREKLAQTRLQIAQLKAAKDTSNLRIKNQLEAQKVSLAVSRKAANNVPLYKSRSIPTRPVPMKK